MTMIEMNGENVHTLLSNEDRKIIIILEVGITELRWFCSISVDLTTSEFTDYLVWYEFYQNCFKEQTFKDSQNFSIIK